MKPGTIVIIKLVCFIIIGFCTPLSTALAQYANTGDWPTNIVWVCILIAALTGAATQVLSFLSNAFAEWKASQNGAHPPLTTPPPSTDIKTP